MSPIDPEKRDIRFYAVFDSPFIDEDEARKRLLNDPIQTQTL